MSRRTCSAGAGTLGAPLDGNADSTPRTTRPTRTGHVIPLDAHIRLANPRTTATAGSGCYAAATTTTSASTRTATCRPGTSSSPISRTSRRQFETVQNAWSTSRSWTTSAVRRRLLLRLARRPGRPRLVRPDLPVKDPARWRTLRWPALLVAPELVSMDLGEISGQAGASLELGQRQLDGAELDGANWTALTGQGLGTGPRLGSW